MTQPPSNPMTRSDLLELAALDALALLDEYETALYDRSFHQATPAVQDEIKSLQASITSNPPLVSDDCELPADLRQRVLDAVADAAESESLTLAPLAAIGRPSRNDEGVDSTMNSTLSASGQVWRAAAFLLAATVLVSMYFGNQLLNTNRDLTHDMREVMMGIGIEGLVGDAASLVNDPSAIRFAFRPTDENTDGGALLIVNEGKGREAVLIPVAMENGEYTLIGRDSNGNQLEAMSFDVTSRLEGVSLGQLSQTALAAASWEIADSSGNVLLRA